MTADDVVTGPPGAAPFTATTYRVLLIEDDPGDALLVEEYLSDTSLDVDLHWAQTLADGLANVAKRAPDCVLLDLHLPDATGIGAVRRMQDACAEAAIIVLTGLAEDRAGVEAVAAGAQDYLVKGVVSGALLDRAVRYAVQRKHAEQTAAQLRLNHQLQQENHRLERGLLPAPLLAEAKLTTTSRYLPSREGALLAGDFLDVVETPDGTVHAVVGDVSGHDPDAAAMGVCLRIAWRTLVLGGHREADLLAVMDRILDVERTSPSMFATVATLSLPRGGSRVEVTLAGHDAPLLIEPGGARQLEAAAGIALGLMPGAGSWQTTRLPLPPTGSLLLSTDGLTEGHVGPGRERLGMDGLLSLISRAPDRSGPAFLDYLTSTTREIDAGRHLDDIAILLLSWTSAL